MSAFHWTSEDLMIRLLVEKLFTQDILPINNDIEERVFQFLQLLAGFDDRSLQGLEKNVKRKENISL